MSNLEIEKKFVLDGKIYEEWLTESRIVSCYHLRQAYLTPADSPAEVRLRHERLILHESRHDESPAGAFTDGKGVVTYAMTIKVPIAHSDTAVSRREFDIDLERDEFNAMIQKRVGQVIEKVRTEYEPPQDLSFPAGWHGVQVDVFRGHLQGLVLAEIEFDRWDQAEGVELPAVIAKDVSGDPRYKNVSLAHASGPPK